LVSCTQTAAKPPPHAYLESPAHASITGRKPNSLSPLKDRRPRGPHRLDYDALKQHVDDFPDSTQRKGAAHFGVSKHCISYAPQKLNITRKKQLGSKEQCPVKRAASASALAAALRDGKVPVYIDERCFTRDAVLRYVYAPSSRVFADLQASHRV